MSTITKESIADTIEGLELLVNRGIQSVYIDMAIAGMRRLLASLEAEPVAYIIQDSDARGRGEKGILRYFANISDEDINEYEITVTPLYTAPPATVSVPDEITFEKIAEITASQGYEYSINECICAASWWNACRAAMLKSFGNSEQLEPVTTDYKLRDAVEIIRNSGIEIDAEKIFAERDALNTPDCWCRTCRPITLTDMRFVVCPDCGNKRCPHANDHRNGCTGSNEPGQEGSAYPAAPQQEAKNV